MALNVPRKTAEPIGGGCKGGGGLLKPPGRRILSSSRTASAVSKKLSMGLQNLTLVARKEHTLSQVLWARVHERNLRIGGLSWVARVRRGGVTGWTNHHQNVGGSCKPDFGRTEYREEGTCGGRISTA